MIDLRTVPTNDLLDELARRDDPLDALVWQLQGMRGLRLLQEAGYTFTPSARYIIRNYIMPKTTG